MHLEAMIGEFEYRGEVVFSDTFGRNDLDNLETIIAQLCSSPLTQ